MNDFIDTLHRHITEATNGDKIKPYITIFSPTHAPKIYNNQIIRYAGYEHADDPSEKEITRLAEHLGWQGKAKVLILMFYHLFIKCLRTL